MSNNAVYLGSWASAAFCIAFELAYKTGVIPVESENMIVQHKKKSTHTFDTSESAFICNLDKNLYADT